MNVSMEGKKQEWWEQGTPNLGIRLAKLLDS